MSRTPLLLAFALSFWGCTDDPEPRAPASSAPAAQAGPKKAAQQTIEIQDAGGTVEIRIQARSGGGFRLLDGAGKKIGKLTIESDRVKAKDDSGTLRAKVKKKATGFKLCAANDAVVFKGKLSGEGELKIKNDAGTLAKLQGATGKMGSDRVEAKVTAAGVEVRRAGQVVARVKGSINAEPATLLALKSLDVYQQAALIMFVQEVW